MVAIQLHYVYAGSKSKLLVEVTDLIMSDGERNGIASFTPNRHCVMFNVDGRVFSPG